MTAPVVFRSRLAQGLAVLVAVVGLVALIAFVGESGPQALLRTAAPVALVVALGWAAFWRPHAVISDDGVRLVNVLRTVDIPWARFSSADSRWALTVTTDRASYSAWAVPAGSGFGARAVPRIRTTGDVPSPVQRKLDSTGTAEAAALEIAERVKRLGRGGRDGAQQVSVTWHTRVLAVLGGLALLATLSVVLG